MKNEQKKIFFLQNSTAKDKKPCKIISQGLQHSKMK